MGKVKEYFGLYYTVKIDTDNILVNLKHIEGDKINKTFTLNKDLITNDRDILLEFLFTTGFCVFGDESKEELKKKIEELL